MYRSILFLKPGRIVAEHADRQAALDHLLHDGQQRLTTCLKLEVEGNTLYEVFPSSAGGKKQEHGYVRPVEKEVLDRQEFRYMPIWRDPQTDARVRALPIYWTAELPDGGISLIPSDDRCVEIRMDRYWKVTFGIKGGQSGYLVITETGERVWCEAECFEATGRKISGGYRQTTDGTFFWVD